MAGSKSLSVYSLEEAANHFAAALALLDKNPDCASDDQFAEFLVSFMLLLNMSGKVNVMIDVLGRYSARIDRLGDDHRAVLIQASPCARIVLEHPLSGSGCPAAGTVAHGGSCRG